MARGFFKGMLWGTGVSLGAVVVLSVWEATHTIRGNGADDSATRPVPSRPELTAEPDLERDRTVALPPPEVPILEPDKLPNLLSDAVAPAAIPQTGAASALKSTEIPQSNPLTGIEKPLAQAPHMVVSKNTALEAPQSEAGASVVTDTAQPEISDPEKAFGTDTAVQNKVLQYGEARPKASQPPAPLVAVEITQPEMPKIPGQATSISVDPLQPSAPEVSDQSGPFTKPAPENNKNKVSEEAAPQDRKLAALAQEDARGVGNDPLEAGILAVDAPLQPVLSNEKTGSDLALTAEAVAPATSLTSELAAPDVSQQEAIAGESLSAQVLAEVSVSEPPSEASFESVGKVDVSISPVSISPVPMKQNGPRLPEVGRDDAAEIGPESVQPPALPERDTRAVPSVDETVPVKQLPALETTEPKEQSRAPSDDPVVPAAMVAESAPVEQFAAAFENLQGKPLMAVVLMDAGVNLNTPDLGLETLKKLPYSVSFAVDPLLPDAAERMAAYRSAGFEVLAMVDLPLGAQVGDVEVNLSVALETLPEVIGVLDGVRTGIQATPEAGRQLAQILAQSGHGFVSQNRGLNIVQKLVAREGVPSAVVFRDFDAKGQDSTVIRRFFDHAAFRASQKGAVIMLGRLREETLAALVLWTLQDRSETVAMSPVSAVLRGE